MLASVLLGVELAGELEACLRAGVATRNTTQVDADAKLVLMGSQPWQSYGTPHSAVSCNWFLKM